MKTTILLLAALSGILHAQGPLDPPAGPAPTMKSLDQIEPRTPISSLPYTILQPGSYYFTGNLQHTGNQSAAISINAPNVTLDLMGFTLSSSFSVMNYPGIFIGSSVDGVTVKNGSIVGNTSVTLSGDPVTWAVSAAGFRYGIDGRLAKNASFEDLSISGTQATGLRSGDKAKIKNVSCWHNGGTGIDAPKGSVTNCTASENGGTGIFATEGSVTNCTASENGGTGIFATEGSVTNCTASKNGDVGIFAVLGTVTSCNTNSNGGTGISAYRGSVTGSTAAKNEGVGIYATEGSVTNCAASSNTGNDISASNAVVAYCRFTTFATAGSTRTGNFPSP